MKKLLSLLVLVAVFLTSTVQLHAQDESVSEEAVQDPNSLQASDLNTMATVIEATAQRGAIRANEMQIVGQLYSKLNHFLILNGIRQAPGSEETAPAEEAPAENKITGENEND